MSIGKRKSFQAGLAVMIAVVIVLAGTFAWYNFTQSALNIFEGITNPGVNVIDDYEDGKQNKDVYVENSGEQPLYVRVRFDEYMEINGDALDVAWVKNSYATWHSHDYMGTSPDYCTDDHDMHTYYKWILGDQDDTKDKDGGWKYFLPSPFEKQALFDAKGKQIKNPIEVTYYNDSYEDRTLAELYGSQSTDWANNKETAVEAYERIDTILATLFTADAGFVSTFEAANAGKAPTNADYLAHLYSVLDAAVAAANNTAAIVAAQEALYTFCETNELGYYDEVWQVDEAIDFVDLVEGTNYFDEFYNNAYDNTLVDSEVVFVPIKRTLTTQKVYTMEAWLKAGMPSGDFWVVDEDGWCYWANVLLPGDATGLLLSEVILDEKNRPAGNWWYGINVTLEATTYSDIQEFYGNTVDGERITPNGIMLLDMVSGNYVFDLDTTPASLVNGLPKVHTFANNGDNTYRVKDTVDGPYDMLFVYTGTLPLPVPTNDKGSLIKASAAPEYAIGSQVNKYLPGAGTRTKFTVLDAGHVIAENAYGSTGSGVVEVNGKRYILLGYGEYTGNTAAGDADHADYEKYEKIAWLAAGPDGTFDKLTGTAPAWRSDADDVLIWTPDDKLPGTGYDRYVEDESKPEARIGQYLPYQIDSKDWLVLGFADDGEDQTQDRKALLISKDVLVTGIAEGGIEAEIAKFKSGGGASELTNMLTLKNATAGVQTVEPRLLTVKEAIDYFADGRARIGYKDGEATEWWLSDGVVSEIGNVDSTTSVTNAGIRVAVWVDSDKLSDYLEAEAAK